MRRILDSYDEAERIPELNRALLQRFRANALFASAMQDFVASYAPEDAAWQASLSARANTLDSLGLKTLMSDSEAQVCMIVAVRDDPYEVLRGTGFSSDRSRAHGSPYPQVAREKWRGSRSGARQAI